VTTEPPITAIETAPGLGDRTRPLLIRLLAVAFDEFSAELYRRVAAAGFADIRPGHGCVFGNIDAEGSRLTDLAVRANMTKQSVGEVTSDLERRGYVERMPDPDDGRAKIIRLTPRGREVQAIGRRLIDEAEQEWAERFGEERIAALREALEVITAERLAAVYAA
jgi:DNA-binding MarR family transcriptional regulator